MSQVDFDYIGKNGVTIYNSCFTKYTAARFALERPERGMKDHNEKCVKLAKQTEAVFEFLVDQGNKYGFNVDSILEIPDSSGGTCFGKAAGCSLKISNYILGRSIQVNTIDTRMMVPKFIFPDLTIRMMEKGINPHVISYKDNCPLDDYPSGFESEKAKLLLLQFPRSVHFSIEDINCRETCPEDCSSQLKRFFCKNGSLVEMTDENRIGTGGFGMVFRQLFHGRLMAMKCVWTGEIPESSSLTIAAVVSVLDENITEIRTQTSTVGPGILVPEAFVRQQDQEQDEDGKWIANNYNIFIYPLYDYNLYELHKIRYDDFTEEILRDILNQCLTRKDS